MFLKSKLPNSQKHPIVAHTTIGCYINPMFERCLYFNINALSRQINKIWEQAFKEYDLSPSHAYLLRVVLANPQITQKEITEELNLEKSTITRFIDNLETRGYLTRMKNGREHFIQATTKARKLEKALNEKGDQLYKQMTKAIGRNNLVSLVSQLRESSSKLK